MVYSDSNYTSVNDTSKLLEDISSLYLSEKFSDIRLNVGTEIFYAHKVILASRSSYFSSLLYNQAKDINQSELELNFPPKAIQEILKFLYTGKITIHLSNIEPALEILSVAIQCNFKDLEVNLVQKIKTLLNLKNVCPILNIANLYDLEDLREACYNFMDQNASQIISDDCLNDLNQKSLIQLLERDSFVVSELNIFKGVEKWCKNNEDFNENLVVKCVRLSWLSVVDIISEVWPSKLVNCEDLLQAIAEIIDVKPNKSKPRAKWIHNINVATPEYKATVITGKKTSNLLNGNRNVDLYAEYTIGDKNAFTIKFSSPYVINHIHMMLWDKDTRFYNYYIEGSTNGKIWKKIIDYSMYPCRSIQQLFFQKEIVQFIRIVGTHNTANEAFHLVYFEAYFKETIPKVINHLICPTENVATLNKKAIVIEGTNGNALLDGITNNYNNFTSHIIGAGSIVVQLAQPYLISSVRLLLWDEDKRTYKYFIETSINKSDWVLVADNRNKESKSWQIHNFEEKPVVFIKITGTANTANSGFHLMHFECPSSIK